MTGRNCGTCMGGLWCMFMPRSAKALGCPPSKRWLAATACVVTDTVGTRDYARGEENCLLVSYGDHEGMAKAIVRLIRDGALRGSLERAGRLTAGNYRWERSLERFEQELLEVVGRCGPVGRSDPQAMPLAGR